MAIQFRHGSYADFQPNKMTEAEPAVVQSGDPNTTNGKSVYVAYSAGDVDRLLTAQDKAAQDAINTQMASDISDLNGDIADTNTDISGLRGSMTTLEQNLTGEITDLKADLNESVGDLKSALDEHESNIFANNALFDGVIHTESEIGWTVGYIKASTGELVPGKPNGDSYNIYSDLISSDENITLTVTSGYRIRYVRYDKDTGTHIDTNGWATVPYSITLTSEYAYRLWFLPVAQCTQEQASTTIEDISSYISLSVPIYPAPITAERLKELGVLIENQVTWDVGIISPSTGEFTKNGSSGGNYYVVSSLIKTNHGFSIDSSLNTRWFWYDKDSGAYVSGVNIQTAPVSMAFSNEYGYRIQVLGGTSISDAHAIADNIDDYIMLKYNTDADSGWITFLPITDVYVGDVQQRIYFNELARYNENDGYFAVSVDGATYPEVTYTDRYVEFNATGTKTITLTITYYFKDTPTATKTLTVHCNPTAFSTKKVMFLGDSYTQNGGMVKWFKDHNGENVTLYGTRTTTLDGVTYQHEGRGGWTAGNYINNASVGNVSNPFYNPSTETFDFSYYMSNAGSSFTDVQIVNILLGRNSGFPVSNMDNLDTIVASIKSYNPNIIVVLMCDSNLAADNSGAGAYMQNVHTANKQSHIYNKAFYERYKDSTDIVMCFANLNLDNVYDFETEEVDASITNPTKIRRYTDNVHPWNVPGLGKFGIALNGLLRNILT